MVSGGRVWCLGAKDSNDLEQWMRAIAKGTKRLEIDVVIEGGTKKITTSNPKAKLVNRLGHYGGKMKKGKGKMKKGRGSVVLKRKSMAVLAGVGGGEDGETKE
jgi:hypothetical protein